MKAISYQFEHPKAALAYAAGVAVMMSIIARNHKARAILNLERTQKAGKKYPPQSVDSSAVIL